MTVWTMAAAALASATILLSSGARAASLDAWLYASGDDIVLSYSGQVDTAGFDFSTQNTFNGTTVGPDSRRFGATNGTYDLFFVSPPTAFSGETFGSGSSITERDTATGDVFFVEILSGFAVVGLPAGASGVLDIAGGGTVEDETLASIGAVAGSYDFTLGNTSITLTVGSAPPAIPLPASLPLLAAGVGLLALRRRRGG